MKMTTEATAIKNSINLICAYHSRMKDDDAIRAVRTLRQIEIKTVVSAGAW